MKETTCGHQPYYAKESCRNCYERNLRNSNPDFVERQRANTRQWVKKNYTRKLQVAKAYNKRMRSPESNERKKLKAYNLTPNDYQQMLDAQSGVCAICGKEPTNKKLAVDHNHQTGVIRGLLCFRCNFGLDWFQDDLERFYKVIAHLKGENVCVTKLAPTKTRRSNSEHIHVGV